MASSNVHDDFHGSKILTSDINWRAVAQQKIKIVPILVYLVLVLDKLGTAACRAILPLFTSMDFTSSIT